MFGPYAPFYWLLIVCNVIVAPGCCGSSACGRHVAALFVISLIVNVGMWLERFVIIVVSLHRDFLPSSWGMYYPTFWDWSTFIGTIGLFFSLLFLFMRLLPMISIFEMRTLLPEAEVQGRGQTWSGAIRPIYGLLAEFSDADELVGAARETRAAGYRQFDCYTPFPIEELAEAMGEHHSASAAAGADRRHSRRRRRLRAAATGRR